jgi:hypothetical protein
MSKLGSSLLPFLLAACTTVASAPLARAPIPGESEGAPALPLTSVEVPTGSTQELSLLSSEGVPGAEGQVSVDASGSVSRNTLLAVRVKDLPSPDRVAWFAKEPATVYVVWAAQNSSSALRHDPGATPANLGALDFDEDFKGTLSTLTPMQEFDLFITPEASAEVTKPINLPVLTAHVRIR